jgi:hypothetical protein
MRAQFTAVRITHQDAGADSSPAAKEDSIHLSKQTKERRAYFLAGAGLFGSYSFVAGLILTVVVSLASAILDLSSYSSVVAMGVAWLASNAVISFWLTVTSDRADLLDVPVDPY